MSSPLCASGPSAGGILEGQRLPTAGLLLPAEIRDSQAMRRPSNILTADGSGQWSGCVCVNTSSQNTHVYGDMLREYTNAPPPLPPLPLTPAPELIAEPLPASQSHIHEKRAGGASKNEAFTGFSPF